MKKIGIISGLAALVLVLASCGTKVTKPVSGGIPQNDTVPATGTQGTDPYNNYMISLAEKKRVKEARNEDGEVICNAVWYDLCIASEDAAPYPLLGEYLESFNARNEASITEIYDDLLLRAKQWTDYSPTLVPYLYCESDLVLHRADLDIISAKQTTVIEAGGMHPYTVCDYINVDASGNELKLSGILNSTNGFNDIVINALRDQDAELVETYKCDEIIAQYAIDDFNWGMDYDGVVIYFEEYEIASYAAGATAVRLSFSDHPTLFYDRFQRAPAGGYAQQIETYPEFSYRDEDGILKTLTVWASMSEENECLDGLRINGTTDDTVRMLYINGTYFVKDEAGKCYLLVEYFPAHGDTENTLIYRLDGGNITKVCDLYGINLYTEEVKVGEDTEYREVFFNDPTDMRLDEKGGASGARYRWDTESGKPVKK